MPAGRPLPNTEPPSPGPRARVRPSRHPDCPLSRPSGRPPFHHGRPTMMPSGRSLIALGMLAALFGPASPFPRWLRDAGRAGGQVAEIGEVQRRERARAQDLIRSGEGPPPRIAAQEELLGPLPAGPLAL